MARTMLWAPFAILTAVARLASADVEFVSPKAGDKITGGGAIVVEWKDSGETPAIADLTTYELFLCAGGNENFIQLPITHAATSFTVTGNKATGTVGKDFGASTPQNAYFLMMISTAAKGGTVTNFSKRFTLTGMTGVFPQAVIDAMKEVKGTSGPDTKDNTANAVPVDPAAGDFGVEYTMQTGLTRFAPMQPVPPTKITKNKATPLFPTSGYTIATTFLPTPKIATTITQSQTFSVKSHENTAAPAPMPSDDMAKFLARWKD